MDGSQWVNTKALTPGGFDAIFPRREPTWEELVNNICPSSGRLTPTTSPQPPHLHTHTHRLTHTNTPLCWLSVLPVPHKGHLSGQACPKLDTQGAPGQASWDQREGPPEDPSHSRSIPIQPKSASGLEWGLIDRLSLTSHLSFCLTTTVTYTIWHKSVSTPFPCWMTHIVTVWRVRAWFRYVKVCSFLERGVSWYRLAEQVHAT